jgi:peptidoglycan/LPS O-acetylase OafA/YrhL
MQAIEANKAYETIDGLRAVGAFLVVMRHAPMFFGKIYVPESFLAVDLFYLVSGFVVANAYGARLAAGGFGWTFVKTRLIRLYPLYLFGLAWGLLAAVLAFVTDPHGWWTWEKLISAVLAGIFMVPMFPGMKATGTALDGPTWTLLPELIANFLYAGLIRWMTVPVMLGIVTVSGAVLVYAAKTCETLDVGFGPTEQWAALARVCFSFFAGVLIYRFHGNWRRRSGIVSWLCVAAVTLMLAWRPSDDAQPWYELGMVVVGFPLLLAVATRFEPGHRSGKIFAWLGLMSYAVYLLHLPTANLLRVTIDRNIHSPNDWRAFVVGGLFIGGLLVLSSWLDKYYDGPVRQWLRDRFMPHAKPKAANITAN